MAANRHATGLTILRLFLGVFFLVTAIGKLRWLMTSSPLRAQLTNWAFTAAPAQRWYLEHVAIAWAPVFARLVVAGELATGLALIAGVRLRLASLLAFLMVLNFHFASGLLFHYAFLTNGYALPVLGGLLALAIGGANLPFSLGK